MNDHEELALRERVAVKLGWQLLAERWHKPHCNGCNCFWMVDPPTLDELCPRMLEWFIERCGSLNYYDADHIQVEQGESYCKVVRVRGGPGAISTSLALALAVDALEVE